LRHHGSVEWGAVGCESRHWGVWGGKPGVIGSTSRRGISKMYHWIKQGRQNSEEGRSTKTNHVKGSK